MKCLLADEHLRILNGQNDDDADDKGDKSDNSDNSDNDKVIGGDDDDSDNTDTHLLNFTFSGSFRIVL